MKRFLEALVEAAMVMIKTFFKIMCWLLFLGFLGAFDDFKNR